MSESLIFAEYMQPLWKIASLRVSPGFSAQAYRLHGRETIGNYSPRAQAVFTIQPARGQFAQIGGAYGNSYPQLAMITDAVTQVDMLQQRRGNPDLKQTRITQAMAVYSLGIGKVNFQLMVIVYGSEPPPLGFLQYRGRNARAVVPRRRTMGSGHPYPVGHMDAVKTAEHTALGRMDV